MASRASTMHQLIADFIDTLNSEKDEILDLRDYQDRLHEEADSHVPIYNSTLAELLADDQSLATLDDPGLVSEDADIWKRIQVAIYERLLNEANEWYRDAKEARDSGEEDDDDEVIAEYRVPTDRELKALRPGARIFVKAGGLSPRHAGMATIRPSSYAEHEPRDRRGLPTGFNVTYDNGRLDGWVNVGRVLLLDDDSVESVPAPRAARPRQPPARKAVKRKPPARTPARKRR